jgi:hypothetical protein
MVLLLLLAIDLMKFASSSYLLIIYYPSYFLAIFLCLFLQVLEVLCSSTELLALLCRVETVYCTRHAGSASYMNNDLYKYIQTILEQLQVGIVILIQFLSNTETLN